MKPTPTLYSVKGYQGAHVLLDMRDTEAGTVADVQLIGAILPFSVDYCDLSPFEMSNKFTAGDLIVTLAQEAATVYNLDPGRIQRAAEIARDPYAVQNAHRDEFGEPIEKPSLKTQCVKSSSKGWYVVRPNFCTCLDNARGNVCKHRIAAWMRRESITRPLAQARQVAPAVILAELTA